MSDKITQNNTEKKYSGKIKLEKTVKSFLKKTTDVKLFYEVKIT